MPTFAALLGAQKGLTIATLIDLQKTSQQSVENLYRRKLLHKSHVMTFADFTGTAEADIEDMFDVAFYLKLVNAEYGKQLSKKPKESDMKKSHHPRILVRLEQFFKTNPLAGPAGFGHFRPARYFTENVATLKKSISAATLDRFEGAFKRLNGLLT